MLTKIFQLVKKYQTDIILFIGVVLISLLSFAIGYITAKEQEKEPIKFEQLKHEESKNSNYRSRDLRALSRPEAF